MNANEATPVSINNRASTHWTQATLAGCLFWRALGRCDAHRQSAINTWLRYIADGPTLMEGTSPYSGWRTSNATCLGGVRIEYLYLNGPGSGARSRW
ncbi:MAG: hypothetical protein R2932_22840 [Caldilineaceae bacterium]